MSLKLIEDWSRVLRKAWSIRLIILAGALSGLEIVLPMFSDAIPRNIFALLTMIVAVGAAVARLTSQPKMRGEQ